MNWFRPQKSEVLAQATILPTITINNYELEVVDKFIYLGPTISRKFSLNRELDRLIGMTASILTRFNRRLWKNT